MQYYWYYPTHTSADQVAQTANNEICPDSSSLHLDRLAAISSAKKLHRNKFAFAQYLLDL